jgi:3'-phosphoadenosine 5'-phosphosulfate (PAPS) 3'-phosphatase
VGEEDDGDGDVVTKDFIGRDENGEEKKMSIYDWVDLRGLERNEKSNENVNRSNPAGSKSNENVNGRWFENTQMWSKFDRPRNDNMINHDNNANSDPANINWDQEVDWDRIVCFVDPLDGTREFAVGSLECVSCLIGLSVDTKAVAGIIAEPFRVRDGWAESGIDGNGNHDASTNGPGNASNANENENASNATATASNGNGNGIPTSKPLCRPHITFGCVDFGTVSQSLGELGDGISLTDNAKNVFLKAGGTGGSGDSSSSTSSSSSSSTIDTSKTGSEPTVGNECTAKTGNSSQSGSDAMNNANGAQSFSITISKSHKPRINKWCSQFSFDEDNRWMYTRVAEAAKHATEELSIKDAKCGRKRVQFEFRRHREIEEGNGISFSAGEKSAAENGEKLNSLSLSAIYHMGAAGAKFLELIEGRVDVFLLNPNSASRWDICAGEAILRGMGGR